jgi:hypothetical protein
MSTQLGGVERIEVRGASGPIPVLAKPFELDRLYDEIARRAALVWEARP